MHSLATLIDRHGITVEDHLDLNDLVPVNTGLQRVRNINCIGLADEQAEHLHGDTFHPVDLRLGWVHNQGLVAQVVDP